MSSSNTPNVATKTAIESMSSLTQPATDEQPVFFYGALMHPMIVRRAIATENPSLEVAPAILHNHTRLHVTSEDYPALVPSKVASNIVPEGRLREEDTTVRGVLVKGLTKKDLELLDAAEGENYSRETVQCTTLARFMPLSSVHSRQVLGELTSHCDSSAAITAYAYTWNAPIDQLSPQVWPFADFLEENVYSWFRKIPPSDPEHTRDFAQHDLILGPVGGEGVILPVTLRGDAIVEAK
ncbi:hypothetical protein FRC01_009627 [Tulasnella sp. 417]|nr:hypothetical protein FRC01_009627 [Tulasnella sp. 417]